MAVCITYISAKVSCFWFMFQNENLKTKYYPIFCDAHIESIFKENLYIGTLQINSADNKDSETVN